MVDSRKSAAGHVQMRRRSRYARWRVFVVVVVGRPADSASPVCGCILYTYCRVWQTTTIPVRTRRRVYSRRLQGRGRAPTDWSICVVLAFFSSSVSTALLRPSCCRSAVDQLYVDAHPRLHLLWIRISNPRPDYNAFDSEVLVSWPEAVCMVHAKCGLFLEQR
jgi:hypothetical protein